jgi:hypothetical protein
VTQNLRRNKGFECDDLPNRVIPIDYLIHSVGFFDSIKKRGGERKREREGGRERVLRKKVQSHFNY